MTETIRYNGRIPTDPTPALMFMCLIYAFSQLSLEQVQAVTAAGAVAELTLHVAQLINGRR